MCIKMMNQQMSLPSFASCMGCPPKLKLIYLKKYYIIGIEPLGRNKLQASQRSKFKLLSEYVIKLFTITNESLTKVALNAKYQ